MKSVTILILACLASFVAGADKSLFKTCQQSSFCRRCRYTNETFSYEVLVDSLITRVDFLTVDIRNKVNEHLFVLKLEAFKDNIFRFNIDEKTPINPRYRVTEVIDELPSHNPIAVTVGTTEIIASWSAAKAVIKLSPFQIDFYHDNVLSLSVNGKGLMRFEHLRTKPSTLDPNDDPESWEETFMDVVDTKPNGPEAVAIDFTFPQSEILFGIPEHADSFALRRTIGDEPYRLYTLDVTFYELDSRMPIYGAIPVIYGAGINRTVGVFWHNSADTFVDIHDDKTAHFISEAGIIDVFVLLGPSPNEAFKQYTKITGVANLPQLFTLAYHQSRWNYMTQVETLEVVNNFDKNNLPMDTIWLDIEYTNGKRYFTWNYETFPRPLEMMQQLKDTGRHLTYIVDPHVMKDEEYFFYQENKQRGYFIKNKNGSDYEGSCWPGMSSYVDYFNKAARDYYADQYLLENFADNSIETGLWNDMNEPTVFEVPEKTIAKDTIHYGGWEHRYVHSLYAHMQVKGTFDGVKRRGDGKLRPFILTRAFFSGTQKYSAVWTGDNGADWGYLQASIKMCLSISVAGISFCGSDIGGFFGDPEEELFVRWYQAAAYQPFFRSHASFDSLPREPYRLEENSMSIVRKAIRDRYTLLSFWYTMFYEHERFGAPVMRPMLSEFPLDKNAFKLDDQYMLSDKLMVRPVMEKSQAEVLVYFPFTTIDGKTDRWYNFSDYGELKKANGSQRFNTSLFNIPVFQRGGSIIPKKETERKASVYMQDDPITLVVALDDMFSATGTLFIDDEKSFGYRDNEYLYIRFDYNDNQLTCKFIDKDAMYATKSKLLRVIVSGSKFIPNKAELKTSDGQARELKVENFANYFVIQDVNASLTQEWTMTVSGANYKISYLWALIGVLMVHVTKFFL